MRRPVAAACSAAALLAALPVAGLAAPGPHGRGGRPAAPAATVAAKPKAKLRVGDLSRSAATVEAGKTLMVRGRVRNTARRTATPTVSVFLAKAKTGRIALGSGRVGQIRARRSALFAVKVRVPSTVGRGRYNLVTCVRVSYKQTARCATAPRALPVTKPKAAAPAPGAPAAPAPAPAPRTFTDGARSIGDSLFPTIGNGGYDARNYALDLAYDPDTAVLLGTSTMTATATQDLASFSMDLQGLQVSSVTVGGAPAFFAREDTKLIVTPPTGIANGTSFDVAVTYGGVETPVIDPDGSPEGFIPTDTGAVVVCEPIGAQGWFPNNNTPRDKATMDLELTVPKGKEVIGNGRLVSRTADATTETFRWREGQPMATYLSTATVGEYAIAETTSPGGVPLYTAVDTAANGTDAASTPQEVAANQAALLAGGPVVDFFAGQYGAYPFETSGGIITNAQDVGYQLEVQGRPIYTSNTADALEHELAHQWFGDEATLTDWRDIWLAEGFAVWSEWLYAQEVTGTPTTAKAGADTYAISASSSVWNPLIVTDPTELFGSAPYRRGATMLEALRQKIGNGPFRQLLRDWLAQTAYGNGTTEGFVALAQTKTSADLGPFFADWLYTDGKPTTNPPVANP